MSRTQKFMYNSMTAALYQVIVMLVGFVTPRIMLQFYGSEINGLISSITQFITYFNLVEAGLASAAVYSLYKPLADDDHNAINGVISAAKRFYNISGYIFVSLVLALAIIYPIFIKSEVLSSLNVGLLVLVLGVNGALEFFTLAKYRVILTADQKTYIISLSSIVYIIVNTLIIVILAYFRVNIIILRTVSLLAIFLRSIILMIYVRVKYKYINYKSEPNSKALDKRWDALFLQILQSVQIGAPIVIATIFTSLKMVSVYSIFNMVMAGLNGLLGIFISGLSSSFGDVIAKKQQATLQKAYKEFEFLYYSLIIIIYSITMVMLMPFVRIYTSGIKDANYNLPSIGFLFVLNGLLYNIKTPQGMIVISAGLYKETRMQNLIQASIAVIGGVILVPFLGLAGILIASCISNLYRDVDLMIFIPKNVTKLPIKNTAYRMIKIIACLLIVWIPFLFIKMELKNLLQWGLYAIFVALYSTVVVLVIELIFERQQVKSVIHRVKSIMK